MSAAATAAGYLYASGRLRGRGAREQEHTQEHTAPHQTRPAKQKIRVAVVPSREEPAPSREPKPRREPKIEYRTRRRWTAGAAE